MGFVSIQTHVLIGFDFSNPFFKLAFVIVTPTRLYSLQSNRDPLGYGRKGSHLPQLQFQTVLETFTSYGS